MGDPIAPLSIPRLGLVPESATMTNAEYERQVDQRLEAIRVAATKLAQLQNTPVPTGGEGMGTGFAPTPWGDLGGGVVPLKGNNPFKVPIDVWRPVFLEFLWPNLEAAIGLDGQFAAPGQGPLNRMTQLGTDGGTGKGNWIRDQLNEWYSPDTESAARIFRDRYCQDINEMVMAQVQMMQSFQLILRSQTALIELSRYQALRIADETIRKLGQEIKTENEESKKLIQDFAGAAAEVSFSGGGPAILTSVASVLKGVAVDTMLNAVFEGQGEEPWDITEWMHGMLADLRRQIRERSETLQNAIKQLDWYLTGKGQGQGKDSREKLLPANVEI